MKKLVVIILAAMMPLFSSAQETLKKVYDESADPMEQIDRALSQAKSEGKFVVCQVGGNWCPWCLRFADFVSKDSTVSELIDKNFVYVHTNYNPRRPSFGNDQAARTDALMKRLGNPARFGFPVFVVLDENGKVLHIQDSSFLEEGKTYSQQKVLRFFSCWTPEAVK